VNAGAKRYWSTLSVLLVLAASGCRGRSGDGVGAGSGVAQTQVERGPVRLSVVVEPSPARLSDLPKLTLTIDYQQGVTVRKPAFGTALGDFLIRDFREPLPRVKGDREILQQIYTLEPLATGKIPIAPIAVTFTDNRPGGDGQEHAVETEALSVEIASVIAGEVPALDSLRGPAEPVELPQPAGSMRWWGLAVPVVLAGLGLAWWWRRRRRQAAAAQVALSPRELAYLELQRLLEEGLAERDVKLFYVELTGIVRRYIERTTGVRAPEQTTQEFLCEIGRAKVFAGEEGRRLREFLEAADLVKFAAHQPRREDIEESFRRAQVFVGFDPLEKAA